MIDRSEVSGLSIAVIAHVVLFGILSVGFLATPNPVKLKPAPIEVSLVGDVGLESQAPEISTEMPAPAAGESAAEPEPEAAAPEPDPVPAPRPDSATRPADKARPQTPRSSTSTTANPRERPDRSAKPGLVLDDSAFTGPAAEPTPGKSPRPPASAIGAAVKTSLDAEIRRQLKKHWRSPAGADLDDETIVELVLNEDGTVASAKIHSQKNFATPDLADRHREAAVRAIKLASPFQNLPPEYYNYWRRTGPKFDRRLSQ